MTDQEKAQAMRMSPGIEGLLKQFGIKAYEEEVTVVSPDGTEHTEPELRTTQVDKTPAPPKGMTQTEQSADYELALLDPADYIVDDYIRPAWGEFFYDLWPKIDSILAVILYGPRGTGKTLAALQWAHENGHTKVVLCNCHPDMTAEKLLGTKRLDLKTRGGDYWQPGPIMLAAMFDCPLILDEFNITGPSTQVVMNPLCDGVQKGILIPATGERIRWEKPRIICCVNEGYAGTRPLQEAFRDRAEPVITTYLPEADEARLLNSRTDCDLFTCQHATKTAAAIRAAAKGDPNSGNMPLEFDLSPRALFSYCLRVHHGQEKAKAWWEAIIGRMGYSIQSESTRATVQKLSENVGGFNFDQVNK